MRKSGVLNPLLAFRVTSAMPLAFFVLWFPLAQSAVRVRRFLGIVSFMIVSYLFALHHKTGLAGIFWNGLMVSFIQSRTGSSCCTGGLFFLLHVASLAKQSPYGLLRCFPTPTSSIVCTCSGITEGTLIMPCLAITASPLLPSPSYAVAGL